jgi:hypothetical protein
MATHDTGVASLEDYAAEILTHTIWIRMLVGRAVKDDPEFGNKALALLDTALGRLTAEGGPSDPVAIKAREFFGKFLSLKETPMLARPLPLSKKEPKTLRRRFLNWLESGE